MMSTEQTNRPLYVCVSGGDASGKSTQIDAVRDVFAARGVDVVTASIWDGLDAPQVARSLPFPNKSAVHEYLRVLGPAARTHFLFHAMHLAMDCALAGNPKLVLINAYWYKYFATEVAYGGDPTVLRSWAAGFEQPGLTCYLRTSATTAFRRKVTRSDYESGYGGDTAFINLQKKSRVVLDGLATELGWITLDGETGTADLTAAIVQAIDQVGETN